MGRIIPYITENKIHVWNHQPVRFCSWFDQIFPRKTELFHFARLRVHLRSLLSSVEIFQVLTHHSWEVHSKGMGVAFTTGKKHPYSYCEWGLWWTMPINHRIWGGTIFSSIYFQRKQNDPKWWFLLGTYWFTSGWNGISPKLWLRR